MPTIRRCCIVGCLSNSRQHPQLQFFQFPRPENPFHKLWKQACHASLSRILPFKKPVVCALHFQPNCIGGRRLTSSAVPSLRLEVPANLKDVEQQAMFEEIERSRKCAYINAVVFEWLVRANLNPQLRGSITHGMIKEKADNAKQLIGSTNFVADNRWLNRFRETHLSGFAQRLSSDQLKPRGTSLWIRDIVKELQDSFPPTRAERVANMEDMPEQYINYMQQYGEYEEDDDVDGMKDVKDTSYQEQQQQALYQQQQYQNGAATGLSGYDAAGYGPSTSFGHYDQYSYERQQQQHHHHLQQQQQHYQQQFQQQPSHYPHHAQHAAHHHHHHQLTQQPQLSHLPYAAAFDMAAQQLPHVGYPAATHHHLTQPQHPHQYSHLQQQAHAYPQHHHQQLQQPSPHLSAQHPRSLSSSPPAPATIYSNRTSPSSQRSSPIPSTASIRPPRSTPILSSTPVPTTSTTGSRSGTPTAFPVPTSPPSAATMMLENGKRKHSVEEDLTVEPDFGPPQAKIKTEQDTDTETDPMCDSIAPNASVSEPIQIDASTISPRTTHRETPVTNGSISTPAETEAESARVTSPAASNTAVEETTPAVESDKPEPAKTNGLTNGHHTSASGNSSSKGSSGVPSPAASIKSVNAKTNGHQNGTVTPKPTNGNRIGVAEAPKELHSYEQALEYLKPLEDFVLIRENFRAIGLLAQLEAVLCKSAARHKKKRIC